MIEIKNVTDIKGKKQNLRIKSDSSISIDGTSLTLFPGLIDPHVHFRTPGHEYKEDWQHAAQAALCGGYTTVFDMPNNQPACVTQKRLQEKKTLINNQLTETQIPLHYELYFGADKNNFDQIHKVVDEIIGIKVFMGSSTGDLLMDDDSALHAIFAIAAHFNLLVAVHAEDEASIQERQQQFKDATDFCTHSLIRTPEVAAKAVEKAIFLSQLYGTRLYILHVSCKEELDLIEKAKNRGLPVYAETTPHHLFLNELDYETLGAKVQMNPPLRSPKQQKFLWEALDKGLIDTIGSDHAPHTLDEKGKPFGQAPSGVPGIETTLPLLLNAYNQGHIRLEKIISLTSKRIQDMFHYSVAEDYVLVDLNKTKTVENEALKTKCKWSPFAGTALKGWPRYTILNNTLYDLEKMNS